MLLHQSDLYICSHWSSRLLFSTRSSTFILWTGLAGMCRFSEGPTAVRWHYAISWAKLCWDTVLFITATAESCSFCCWEHIKIQTFPFGLRMVFVFLMFHNSGSLGVQASTSKVFVHESCVNFEAQDIKTISLCRDENRPRLHWKTLVF